MVISVIIPVYNAEKYLSRCLDSIILALGNINGEILLINNNSSDKSIKIAEKYATKYPKVISVLHCNTPGAAAVRNYGFLKAKGEYIWYIDADDEISPDSISLLIDEAEKTKADLVMMGATRVYADGHTDYLSAVKAGEANYKSRFVRYGAGPWQFLIRRKWWGSHNFAFCEGIIHEDMELMSALILYTDNFASIDKPLYLYYQNDESVLHQKKWNEHAFDIFPALTGLYERFKKAGAAEKYHDELEWFFIWNLLIDSAKDFAKFPEGKPGFKRSRDMLSEYFPSWRKNRFLKEKKLRLRIRVMLNRYK